MATDIILNTEGEFLTEAGDFVVDLSDEQNLEDLIDYQKGMLKASPLTGVGVVFMLKRRQFESEIISETRSQMRADGWEIESVSLEAGELNAIGNRND